MLKWLEPSIQNRIAEITDICDEQNSESYNKFITLIGSIPGINLEAKMELENLFILRTRETVDYSYRNGFEEAYKLFSAK